MPPARTRNTLITRWYKNSGEPGSVPGWPVSCLPVFCFATVDATAVRYGAARTTAVRRKKMVLGIRSLNMGRREQGKGKEKLAISCQYKLYPKKVGCQMPSGIGVFG